MSNNTGNTLLALLTGAVIGAGIGILFAPEKGSKTREKLKDGFDEQTNELKDKFDALSEKVKSNFGKSKLDLEATFDDLIANVDDKTQDVILALEKKLQELKKSAAASKN